MRPTTVHEFRQRNLPFVVFGLVLASTAFLWGKRDGRAVLVGHAETRHTIVSAAKPGTILELNVDLLQRVKRGEVLAQCLATAPETGVTLLRAPTDGIVSAIHKHAGEVVVPGDSVLTLGALRPARIVAYARQPLDHRPAVGDSVEVATRSQDRTTAPARILQVGTQLEAIETALLPPSPASARATEYGLPVLVEIPAGLELAPGEIVSLTTRATN